jgi:hypothetical protein
MTNVPVPLSDDDLEHVSGGISAIGPASAHVSGGADQIMNGMDQGSADAQRSAEYATMMQALEQQLRSAQDGKSGSTTEAHLRDIKAQLSAFEGAVESRNSANSQGGIQVPGLVSTAIKTISGLF